MLIVSLLVVVGGIAIEIIGTMSLEGEKND